MIEAAGARDEAAEAFKGCLRGIGDSGVAAAADGRTAVRAAAAGAVAAGAALAGDEL